MGLLESYSGRCVGASVGFGEAEEEEADDWSLRCGAAGRAMMTLVEWITFSRGHNGTAFNGRKLRVRKRAAV